MFMAIYGKNVWQYMQIQQYVKIFYFELPVALAHR